MALSRFVLPYADVGAGIRPSSGAKLFFYATGTSTFKSTFTDATGSTANANPVIANANGVFPSIFLDGIFNIALKDSNDVQIWTADPVSSPVSLLSPPVFSTVAAMVASTPTSVDGVEVVFAVGMWVTIVNYATNNNSGVMFGTIVAGGTGTADGGSYINLANGMQWKKNYQSAGVLVSHFGAVGDGSTNDTAPIQAAINTGLDIIFDGAYAADNLTQSTNGQQFIGQGASSIIKRASGDLLTSTGNNFHMITLRFQGESNSPTFTGHNIVLNGDHPVLERCGSRWAFGRAVKATGDHVLILGTNDIYQTAKSSASDWDIEIVKDAGAASLYHNIQNIYTSQATGGILMTNTGTSSVSGCQFGRLLCNSGVGGAGASGPYLFNCRINGDVAIEQSNTKMSNSSISADVTIGDNVTTLSGVTFASSCDLQSGQTLTLNNIVECDISTSQLNNITIVNNISADTNNNISIKSQAYTPTWQGSSTNPALGNGGLTGSYSRIDSRYLLSIRLAIGSTTTFGSGEWKFGLPDSNTPAHYYSGSAVMFDNGTAWKIAVSKISTGAAFITVQPDSLNSIRSTSPFTWANTDTLEITLAYDI